MRTVKDELRLLPAQFEFAIEPVPENVCVLSGLPDNEGADSVFCDRIWSELDIDDLLAHPTSLWFLNWPAIEYYLPAIIVAVLYLDSTGNDSAAIKLFDHLEAKISKEHERGRLLLSEQSISLLHYAREAVQKAKLAEDMQADS